jgi:hypothetical protein
MIGASPDQSPGEVWATGKIGQVPAQIGSLQIQGPASGVPVLLHRSDGQGWQVAPVSDSQGNELGLSGSPGISYHAVTSQGGIVLADQAAKGVERIIVHNPGASFAVAPDPPGGAEGVLQEGELTYAPDAPLIASLDEAGGVTGALIVPQAPSGTGSAAGVLHYDGVHWTREPICATYVSGTGCATTETFASLKVLALDAASSRNAWLLAATGPSGKTLALFRRMSSGSGSFVWVAPAGWSYGSGIPAGVNVAPLSGGAILTVTAEGVWVDAGLETGSGGQGSISELFPVSEPFTPNTPLRSVGTWCYPAEEAHSLYPTAQSLCGQEAHSLGAVLPNGYQSFAWPESGAPAGIRIIAGLEHGALLALHGSGDFQYVLGGGGGDRGAFASPTDGWLSGAGTIGGNGAQVVHVTGSSEASPLQTWPVPFQHPLLAIAPQPGTTPGDASAQALAVGDQGQVARYLPGQGWTPEFLYNSAGVVQRPRLRGVAWPEAGRGYAVGDRGAMWVWRADTELWEPDPAEPLGLSADLTAIAFSSADGAHGYAVGKQGTLLAYGKTWEQQPLPPGLEQADFTSVAFAGAEALATYRVVTANGTEETGGLLVKEAKEGSVWQVDQSAQTLLAQLPPSARVLSRVSGLPDGGAVAAGPGVVIERDSAGGPWRFSSQPLPETQNVDALAAIREGPSVHALISIDADSLGNPNQSASIASNQWLKADVLVVPGFGQPPAQPEPDPLPVSGYLLRETSSGWQDLEHRAYTSPLNSTLNLDEPNWPDAGLAFDLDPSGTQGWVVGGQTGGILAASSLKNAELAAQTASVSRLGTGPAPPQSNATGISAPAGETTFAVGGNSQCAGPCADFANEGLGPDVWLSSALARAAQVSGVQGFLYAGAHISPPSPGQLALNDEAFARELAQYKHDLDAGGGMPVYPAASPTDSRFGSVSAFDSTILGPHAGSAPPGTPAPPVGTAAYAFESGGSGGTVRVVVLDYSTPTLAPGELVWLATQLSSAKQAGVPTIVMGSADLVDPEAPNYAQDAAAVSQVLLQDGASAYFFDSPGENRAGRIGSGSESIPVIGTGTLGYVPPQRGKAFLGASGFLLASVNVARRASSSNRAPVTVTLVPNIAQLALDATDGTLLRRSQVALFDGLARRPAAGFELAGGLSTAAVAAPEPYVPIPEICEGSFRCAEFIAPSYSFSSSNPDIGDFVEQDPNIANPRAVLQGGPGGKPIPDRYSGLFCAFNAGTTTVSVQTGGLVYSEQVTVQGGSVEQPCGTVPLLHPPLAESAASTTPPPPPTNQAPSGASPTPVVPVPPPLALPIPPALRSTPLRVPAPRPFFVLPPPSVPLAAALLPLSPVLARPIPPSGTAPVSVFSPAVAPHEEREEEEAVESVHNMAAYHPDDPLLPPVAWLALIVLAAAVGAGARTTGRAARKRDRAAFAYVGRDRAVRRRSARARRW